MNALSFAALLAVTFHTDEEIAQAMLVKTTRDANGDICAIDLFENQAAHDAHVTAAAHAAKVGGATGTEEAAHQDAQRRAAADASDDLVDGKPRTPVTRGENGPQHKTPVTPAPETAAKAS